MNPHHLFPTPTGFLPLVPLLERPPKLSPCLAGAVRAWFYRDKCVLIATQWKARMGGKEQGRGTHRAVEGWHRRARGSESREEEVKVRTVWGSSSRVVTVQQFWCHGAVGRPANVGRSEQKFGPRAAAHLYMRWLRMVTLQSKRQRGQAGRVVELQVALLPSAVLPWMATRTRQMRQSRQRHRGSGAGLQCAPPSYNCAEPLRVSAFAASMHAAAVAGVVRGAVVAHHRAEGLHKGTGTPPCCRSKGAHAAAAGVALLLGAGAHGPAVCGIAVLQVRGGHCSRRRGSGHV